MRLSHFEFHQCIFVAEFGWIFILVFQGKKQIVFSHHFVGSPGVRSFKLGGVEASLSIGELKKKCQEDWKRHRRGDVLKSC